MVLTLHFVAAMLAALLLIARAYPIFVAQHWQNISTTGNKVRVALQHSSYLVLVITGLWLLWQNQFKIEPWFYAKIILFFVLLSASAKAFKRKENVLLIQRKAGLVIAMIACIAIFILAFLQPQFG